MPNRRNTINGMSQATILELADQLGIPWEEGDFIPFDLYNAGEAFATETCGCMLPIVPLNGVSIGSG